MNEDLKHNIENEYGLEIVKVHEELQSNFVYDYIIVDLYNNSYYLRYVNPSKNLVSDLKTIFKIHDYLNNHADYFNVPKWYRTLNGNITIKNGGFEYILLELLPSDSTNIGWTEDYFYTAQNELHKLLSEIPLSKNKFTSFFEFLKKDEQHFEGDLGNFLQEGADRISVDKRFRKLNHAQQIIHGDFHSNNIFAGKDRINIIDFFNATWDTPLFDLMELIDIFPQQHEKILLKYNHQSDVEIDLSDMQYLKVVKALFYLNRINDNYEINIRLRGSKSTVTWAVSVIGKYIGRGII